jgi:hypothetical protein
MLNPPEVIVKTIDPAAKAVGFRIHATVFVPTMALLLVINLLTGSPFWALWVLLGWGVGLLARGWFVPARGGCRIQRPSYSVKR